MKVFVSSLIAGMEAHRTAVKRAIETLGHEPVMAESFGARASTPQIACLQGVRESDVVLSIFGERYGAVQASGLSATHEEYREARGNKPILPFVLRGATLEPAQQAFINEASTWDGGIFRAEFNGPDDLGAVVTRALHTWELAHSSAPLDLNELRERALGLLPDVNNSNSVSGALLSVGIAAAPLQSVVRPAQLEQPSLAEAMQQEGLFGTARLFDQSLGTSTAVRKGALVVRQKRQHGGDRASVSLSEVGDIVIHVPAERPMERGFMAVIEEEVAERLRSAIGYGNWLLDRIDPTHRLTHVALAARLVGSAWGWRTRAEQAASPSSGSLNIYASEGERHAPVLLTPPHLSRASFKMEVNRIVEDLVVLLRRRWK